MAINYDVRRDSIKEMMNHAYLYTQLFERGCGILVEYVGNVNGVPFQFEPQSKIVYYLIKLDGIYIDIGLSKDRCSVSLSPQNHSYSFNYISSDNHTVVSFELLERLTQLILMINKYIVTCGRIQPISGGFNLMDIVEMDKRFKGL